MKIIFNLMNTGLGNNGGSLTLIKSANTLVELGHEIIIVDSGKNQNTWIQLNCEHKIVNSSSEIPEGDVIIATGMKSIESTNQSKIENKFVWIRGWEEWVYSEDILVQIFRKSPCKKIVNGYGLKRKLKKYGISSEIIIPGYDFDELYPKYNRNKSNHDFFILGGLFNRGKKRTGKRTEWILEALDIISNINKNKNILLWMYGAEDIGPNHRSNQVTYFSNPTPNQKNVIYNSIDVWLAPTELEGLHIPPAEAMLTECAVVGTCAEMNGMDYLANYKTGLISFDNISSFASKVQELIDDKELRLSLGINGKNAILNLGDRKYNMNKLIKLLEG